jgi:hypothetical protein
MPLNEFDSPYPLGSQEERDYRNAMIRAPALAATNVLPTWLSMLAPVATDEDGKTHAALPGLVTSGYGALGTAGPDLANWAGRKATGYNLNIPHAPGAEAALQSAAGNDRFAESVVPHMAPQSPEEEALVDITKGGAAFAVPGLGTGAGISRLPRAVQLATHVALPGLGMSTRSAITGAVLTGGAGAYEESKTQQTQQELTALAAAHDKGIAPAQAAVRPQQPVAAGGGSAFDAPMDLSHPDTSHTVATPAMGASATLPFATTSGQGPATSNLPGANNAKYDTLAEFGRPDIQITVPDFSTEGETGLSFGAAAMGAAATAAAAVIAMRHGGKVLDPLIKTITGEGDQINTAARRMESNQRLDAIDAGNAMRATDPNTPGATRGEAPLPGKAGTVGTRMAQNLWDQNRVLTEFAKANAPDSGVAKQMEAHIATVNNSTPLMNRVTEQMATGVNLANGGSIVPKWKETLQQYAALKPEQVTRLERGLYAGDELDTRDIKLKQAQATPGASLADKDLRHNYRTTDSAELRAAHADMMADPKTAAIAKQIYQLQRSNMFEARDMGRISSTDMRRIIDQRPRQIPSTNAEGVVEHALGTRDINVEGWDTPPTKAIDAVTQHYGKLYAELNQNVLRHKILESAETTQKADPTAARVVTRLADTPDRPIDTSVGRRIATYSDGVRHVWEIDNTDLYRAMKSNMAKTGLILDTADALRRMYQGGTTGVSAAFLSQRPFALINLNRNILQIGTDRAPGTTFGMLDRGVQRLSGGRFGFRQGVDPTQWIGSYGEAIKGVGAVTAHSMSNSLRNPNNYGTKTLRAVLGDNFVDGLAHSAEQRWLKSNAAQRKAEGVSGAGAGGTYERSTYNVSSSDRSGYSGLHNAVQGVFHPNDIHLPRTKVRIPGTKGLASSYIDMRSWLREIHQEISEGANSYYWKGMRDNPNISREQRVYQTRQVVGDPSVRGAGKAAEWATHYVPWVNPSIQDAVRMMRNLRDNPVAFTLGTMTRLGYAAAASLASAMLGGNKHINMLGHLMSTHDRASNITFFHDPNDEHNYTQISMPQRDRVLYPSILEGIAYGSGAFNLHQDEDMYHRVLHSVLDLFSHHVSHSTAVASREGLLTLLASCKHHHQCKLSLR